MSDARIFWDPNENPLVELSFGRGNKGRIEERNADSAITLAHELIHAYNWVRPGRAGVLDYGEHHLHEGTVGYKESIDIEELRTVALGDYNLPGDITENQIRRQLNLRPRATYLDRSQWQSKPRFGN